VARRQAHYIRTCVNIAVHVVKCILPIAYFRQIQNNPQSDGPDFNFLSRFRIMIRILGESYSSLPYTRVLLWHLYAYYHGWTTATESSLGCLPTSSAIRPPCRCTIDLRGSSMWSLLQLAITRLLSSSDLNKTKTKTINRCLLDQDHRK